MSAGSVFFSKFTALSHVFVDMALVSNNVDHLRWTFHRVPTLPYLRGVCFHLFVFFCIFIVMNGTKTVFTIQSWKVGFL